MSEYSGLSSESDEESTVEVSQVSESLCCTSCDLCTSREGLLSFAIICIFYDVISFGQFMPPANAASGRMLSYTFDSDAIVNDATAFCAQNPTCTTYCSCGSSTCDMGSDIVPFVRVAFVFYVRKILDTAVHVFVLFAGTMRRINVLGTTCTALKVWGIINTVALMVVYLVVYIYIPLPNAYKAWVMYNMHDNVNGYYPGLPVSWFPDDQVSVCDHRVGDLMQKISNAQCCLYAAVSLFPMLLYWHMGNVAKNAAQDLKEPSRDIVGTLPMIDVVAYGVLGDGMDENRTIVNNGSMPDAKTVIVDPAGMHHIQPPGGPCGAGGAAGAIYKFLGINRDRKFPPDVIEGVQKTGDAKYHNYDGRHVVHVVGPDFRAEKHSRGKAVEALAVAYGNVLDEFIASDVENLRLLPISSSIFAGEYKQDMPEITAQALNAAYGRLENWKKYELGKRNLIMCIYSARDVSNYASYLEQLTASPDSLSDPGS